ncbi:hypothetical protein [Gimesia aquarii]|uniref:Uncharacterized protein n=1 Tax=Gimesia aquarii TaxID=2527964 RepID=A0A517VWV6_9PLAN|nr:hypothetical protein [Gimesia aquarii]QDT97484.1 hypothetical protein V144x_29590 [Gimesia aquarii]
MNKSEDWAFEEKLRESLGAPSKADFDHWRSRHENAIAYLNPIVTKNYRSRRSMIVRLTSVAMGILILFALVAFIDFEQQSFARTVKAIDKATTITWTRTVYSRATSEDGKRTWIRTEPRSEWAYRSPNLYRNTLYDEEGNVRSVEIIDTLLNKALHLDIQRKKATWLNKPEQFGPGGPFESVKNILLNKPIELVGQKELNGVKVNVFRYRRDTKVIDERTRTTDIWLDAKTKQLVRMYSPGASIFNLVTDPDRDKPAEKRLSKASMLGSMTGNIVFDAKLDPELFSLIPPQGFEIAVAAPKPTVTESELIEWLGVTARYNGGMFFDTYRGFDLEPYNKVVEKGKANRTEDEQKMVEVQTKHLHNGNGVVMPSFANEYAVNGRFRYLGKGVKLGSTDRIVMFYKLKSTGTYRAIYGDLTVKDVVPEDLPLPVRE